MPTPAPQSSLPCASLALSGYLICFSISLMVIRPLRLFSSSTIGSFSFLALARIFFASSNVMPSFAVIRPSEVMHSLIFLEKFSSNFRSRLVMIPTNLPSLVIGTPEMRNFAISSSASCKVCSSDKENGSVMTPFSERFTLSTSSACASIDIFLWMIPIPPCLAIAIAMRCSVTVSIAALIIGIFNVILLVSFVFREIMSGVTSEYCGTNNTSSKVIPSPIILLIFFILAFCMIILLYFHHAIKKMNESQ